MDMLPSEYIKVSYFWPKSAKKYFCLLTVPKKLKKMEKKIQFFFIFFSLFNTLCIQKDFLNFWAKNNLLLYTQRATCPLDPPKWIFRGLLLKLSNKHGLTFFSPWKIGIGTHTSDKGIMPPQKCSSQKMKEE